jgi:hypothetical protein
MAAFPYPSFNMATATAAPVAAAAPVAPQQLFGVVIPGRALLCNWLPTGTAGTFTTVVEQPSTVPELTFFALPAITIPADSGAVLYYSTNGTDWELLGAIHDTKPSGVFRTGWTTRPELVSCPAVQLGVRVQPLSTLQNLDLVHSGVEDRFAFAHKIAQDLWQYMASFSSSTGGATSQLVVPSNVFDKWMERFTRKYSLDPNFMMKK